MQLCSNGCVWLIGINFAGRGRAGGALLGLEVPLRREGVPADEVRAAAERAPADGGARDRPRAEAPLTKPTCPFARRALNYTAVPRSPSISILRSIRAMPCHGMDR